VPPSEAVWITGVGTATALGHTYAAVADGLLAGRSGVRAVTHFDVAKHRCKVAAMTGDVPAPPGFDAAAFGRQPPLEQLLLWCITGALRDAGIGDGRGDARLGLVLGMGAEWLLAWEAGGAQGSSRARDPRRDEESSLDAVRRVMGLTGPAVTVAAACATGNHALALARHWVRSGWVDACVAGACGREVTPMSLAGFGNIGALTRRNNSPESASRPFDRGRDGFVMGDGGAIFVLESAAAARRRGARAYAEVAGFGAASDAFHMVTPSPDPEPAARAVRAALADARVNPDEVDYVNAHATGTPIGDPCESRVLRLVFGDAVRALPVSSTKSMTGHLLSASAAVEVVACLAALERQALPPTINLDDPDPECDLCHVTRAAQPRAARVVLSDSFGFGGCNTCLVLRKVA
jgi:3-oxoacyl-[acyl-carrier-protein] synthase II